MILQALNTLYDRLATNPEYGLAEPGYSTQKITFSVVLTPEGELHAIQDERLEVIEEVEGKQKKSVIPKQLMVPGQSKSSGPGINPCLLWDNVKYMLCFDPDPKPESDQGDKEEAIQQMRERTALAYQTLLARTGSGKINYTSFSEGVKFLKEKGIENEGDPERTALAFQSFQQRHLQLEQQINDPSFSAVCRFLEKWTPENAANHPFLTQVKSRFGVFRILGMTGYVHQQPRIRSWWLEQQQHSEEKSVLGTCLVTGEANLPIARTHKPQIKGIKNAKPTATLVSFNDAIYESYGREQSFNAPISQKTAFRYCTALNTLLNGPKRDHHEIPLAKDTVLFWTEVDISMFNSIGALFAEEDAQEGEDYPDGQDMGTLQNIKTLLRAMSQGGSCQSVLGEEGEIPFYVLGLSPNAARISVRFWHVSTLGHFVTRLHDHYQALDMVGPAHKLEFPSPFALLRATAFEGKNENISPLLGGTLVRAILNGTPYPDALAMAILRRIRVDEEPTDKHGDKIKSHTLAKKKREQTNHLRAAILKAWLIRSPAWKGDISVSLDVTRSDPAYRLGRLFSALEKTQEEALPGTNATIRDRYYGSVSATPAAVIPRLLRTYQHHLGKLSVGAKITREKLVQEIMNGLDTIPATLSLYEQGLFAIGYYHQRQAFFSSRENAKAEAGSDNP